MFQRIILLFVFVLLSAALFGQKKTRQVKTVHAVPAVRATATGKISPERTLRLAQRLAAQKSLVVLKNECRLLPLGRLDTLKILVVRIGAGEAEAFQRLTGRYLHADSLSIDVKTDPEQIRRQINNLLRYNLVIMVAAEQRTDTTAGTAVREKQAETGLLPSDTLKLWLDKLTAGARSVSVCFGSPRFLSDWEALTKSESLVVADKADNDRTDMAVQLLFGAIGATGKLTFDLGPYPKGTGITFPSTGRLGYALPEELGIDSVRLSHKMDSIVETGLKEKAYPGCQLLLAQNGKVIYVKSYGFHTYNPSQPVRDGDLYDLASVTKVLAPVPALMMLADQKKFLVTKKMSDYWPDWKGSNKEGILVSDLLSHQARLRPGIILWPKTVDGSGNFKPEYYTTQPGPGHDLRVSENLYVINSYQDSVYKAIRNSTLLKSKRYAYSDLGFVILPKVIENLSGEDYQRFLGDKLYARLGASTLMYRPYLSVTGEKIVPTEDDRSFRHELLQGFVHDETAALMGGVAGNAGLFGSAGDVAKVMQLYLQNGEYGNERFISAETLKNWTSSHFQKTNNRRGYGFDKPGIQISRHTGKERYPSSVVSEQSYGHSGFTGTFVWADPAKQLLLVFLSNRVFPDRNNHKINRLKIRSVLLDTFFKLAGDPPAGR